MTNGTAVRSAEEEALFNPGAVAVVLARVCQGRDESGAGPVPIALAFATTLLAFHPHVRAVLPLTIRANFVTWLEDNPGSRIDISNAARGSSKWLREGLLFAINHQICAWVPPDGIRIGFSAPALSIDRTNEFDECQRSAFFLGRWLSKAGSQATVLALLGLRP